MQQVHAGQLVERQSYDAFVHSQRGGDLRNRMLTVGEVPDPRSRTIQSMGLFPPLVKHHHFVIDAAYHNTVVTDSRDHSKQQTLGGRALDDQPTARRSLVHFLRRWGTTLPNPFSYADCHG